MKIIQIKSIKVMAIAKSFKNRYILLSPFILLIVFFVFLFPYLLISGDGPIKGFYLQLIIFTAIIAYVLFLHMVLIKYFGVRKFYVTWIIEFILSAFIISVLI